MQPWPEEVIRFLNRPVPVFIHLAAPASKVDAFPFVCRGYGYRHEPESDRLTIYILKSQWIRLAAGGEAPGELSALFTSGVDNESYQFKGRYAAMRPLSGEDAARQEEQRRWAFAHTPRLAPMLLVPASECLAVGFNVHSVYKQTPGPEAGASVMEGGAC